MDTKDSPKDIIVGLNEFRVFKNGVVLQYVNGEWVKEGTMCEYSYTEKTHSIEYGVLRVKIKVMKQWVHAARLVAYAYMGLAVDDADRYVMHIDGNQENHSRDNLKIMRTAAFRACYPV